MKTLLILTALLGAAAVALGAFGAHRLESVLSPNQMDTYQKAVQYHFIHVLALLALVALSGKLPGATAWWAGVFFVLGIILFSGSLYLWSAKTLLGISQWRFLVFLTPVGGLSFIAGWISLAIGAWRSL